MHAMVVAALPEVTALCERLGVRRLDLFGSAVGEHFDEQRSDVDVLVEFEEHPPSGYFDTFFTLKEGLEQIFGRSVDVVVLSSIRNPYFLRQVQDEAEPLYAA